MTAAHRAVAAELRVPRVLDDIALEDLFTELLLGEGGRHGLVDKVINRLATPALPRPNVDAARFGLVPDRLGLGDAKWVGLALGLGEADRRIRQVDLVDPTGVLIERAAIAARLRHLLFRTGSG